MLGMCGDDHNPSHITLPTGTKILVVSRNPLDACVSRFYHAFNPHKLGWSFDAWAALWLSGNTTYGMVLSKHLPNSNPTHPPIHTLTQTANKLSNTITPYARPLTHTSTQLLFGHARQLFPRPHFTSFQAIGSLG